MRKVATPARRWAALIWWSHVLLLMGRPLSWNSNPLATSGGLTARKVARVSARSFVRRTARTEAGVLRSPSVKKPSLPGTSCQLPADHEASSRQVQVSDVEPTELYGPQSGLRRDLDHDSRNGLPRARHGGPDVGDGRDLPSGLNKRSHLHALEGRPRDNLRGDGEPEGGFHMTDHAAYGLGAEALFKSRHEASGIRDRDLADGLRS